ncbi:MAG TPA: PD-(D/E)XK motif protein [Terracidiphilus sp.]|jgi:hypothetical protein
MSVEGLWAELRTAPAHPAYRRIDDMHPLDFYAGIGPHNDALLMLVTPQEVGVVASYTSLKVDVGSREDGRFAYSLTLKNPNLEHLFAQLCGDLIESSRTIAPTAAASFLAKRLDRWRRLLAGEQAGLTEEESRGLIGELYVLSRCLAPLHGIDATIRGWVGPKGEEQDFRIKEAAFEVKAVEVGKQLVQISSLRQLDGAGCQLFLLVAFLSPSQEGSGSLNIRGLITDIRAAIGDNEAALDLFDASLLAVGYLSEDLAGERYYSIPKIRSYRVTDEFPHLRIKSVPPGIVEAKYTIDLAKCSQFEAQEKPYGH